MWTNVDKIALKKGYNQSAVTLAITGTPGGIRTPDLRIR